MLLCLACSYAAILAALSILNWFGPDRWWFGALNLYLPQAMWLVPGIFLILLSLKRAPSLVWLPVLCIVWVLGPVMGFAWPMPGAVQPPRGSAVRILTWNAKFGRHDMKALLDDIQRNSPDVVLLQDATDMASGPVGTLFRGWNVQSYQQFMIASRLPVTGAETIRISLPGQQVVCLRCQVHVGAEAITLYNVHFQSPRDSLNAFRAARKRPWYLPTAIQQLENNVEARMAEARAIQALVRSERNPVVVAGDLNSTDASLVCATLREAGLHDCFAQSGKGYGYTYGQFLLQRRVPWLTFSWMRIDHIMVSSHLRSLRCWTGTGKASDHRPVIADVALQ